MRTLSHTEAEHLFIERQLPLDDDNLPTPQPSSTHVLKFHIPTDTGKRVCLAKGLLQPFAGKECIVWISDWGIWPSGEHQPMFDRFRQACGESKPLIDTPVHVFYGNESDDALSLFCFCILFLWDCYVISPESGNMVFISHDEVGWAAYGDKADLIETTNEINSGC